MNSSESGLAETAVAMEPWDGRYFRIGRENENYLAYDTKTGLFETRNNFVNDVDAEYKTFKAMFETETIRG